MSICSILPALLLGGVISSTYALPAAPVYSITPDNTANLDVVQGGRVSGQQVRKCYVNTDQVFFSLASAHDFDYDKCRAEANVWAQSFSSTLDKQYTFWSGEKPSQTLGQDLQTPLFHKSESCAIALLTIDTMYEFTKAQKIPWRPEWGSRSVPKPFSQRVTTSPRRMLGPDGLLPALECARQGRAGFSEIESSWVRFFVWPGDFTTFGDIFRFPGATELQVDAGGIVGGQNLTAITA